MKNTNNDNQPFRSYRAEEELDLKEILTGLWSYKRFILLVTLCIVFITGIYVLSISPVYKTEALIQVANDSNSSTSGFLNSLGGLGNSLGAIPTVASPSEIETALLRSRFILQPVIEKRNLDIVVEPSYFPIIGLYLARRHDVQNYYSGTPDRLAEPLFGLRGYAWGGDSLQVSKFIVPGLFFDQKFYIVTKRGSDYELYSPAGVRILQGQVGELANANVNGDFSVQLFINKLNAPAGTRFYLTKKSFDGVLAHLINNFTVTDLGAKSETGVLSLTLTGTKQESLVPTLNTILNYAVEDNIKTRSLQAQKTLVFVNNQLPGIKEDLNKAELRLNQYRSKTATLDLSTEGTVLLNQIVKVEQVLEQLELQKTELLQNFTVRYPLVVATGKKIVKVAVLLAGLKNRVRQLPLQEQKAIELEREVKVKNQLYLTLLDKVQQLRMIKAGTISNVQILNKAELPVKQPDHRALIMLGGLFVGFFLAILLTLLRNMLFGSVDDPNLVEEELSAPVFAIVPHSKTQERIGKVLKNASAFMAKYKSYILSEQSPQDLAAEAIRSLLTTLQFTLAERKNSVVSIMGASPSIGKSFLSANLAYICAESGKKVLLVDADLRRGKLQDYVRGTHKPGLSEVLTNQFTFEEVVQPVASGAFDFVAGGKRVDNPGRMFLNQQMQQFLNKVKEEYEVVIVDTPPILSLTDSVVIAKCAGINLLMVAGKKDTIRELRYVVKKIRKTGADIHGLVFNNTTRRVNKYYNYYRNNYHYRDYK